MSTRSKRLGLAGLAVLAWIVATPVFVTGQQRTPAQSAGPAQKTILITTARAGDDYIIGPEDVLAVNVWKEPEISRVVPVRPDGKISLPLIGDLQARGGTTTELRAVISEKLKTYISNPEVTVIVQEIKSQKFNVLGRVLRPGTYVLSDRVTVLDAIAMAGGFMEFARVNRIYVLRTGPENSQLRLPFDYKAVIKGRKSDQNVELKPGDTVVVP